MTTIIPDGEELRKAVKWISDERQADQAPGLPKLVEQASVRFNLSPRDSEYLMRLLKENKL